MAIYYVSDLLSNLIGAEDVRNIVRKQCETVLIDVPPSTADRLREPLYYIAGKCMGYPAVWITSVALNLNSEQLAERIALQPGPLYISLTTSIADDFIDKDSNVNAAHMMLLYLFVFSSLRHPHWFNGEMLESYRKNVYPLIGAFVGDHPLTNALSSTEMAASAERSGLRIGHFFETIVRGLSYKDPEDVHIALCNIGRSFGNWCSHLDDVVDIEQDIIGGDSFTYPIFLLSNHSSQLRTAVQRKDLDACLEAIDSPWFLDAITAYHQRYLARLGEQAQSAGFDALSGKLSLIAERIAETIGEIRKENSRMAQQTLCAVQ